MVSRLWMSGVALFMPAAVATAQEAEFKLGVVHIEEVVEGSPDFRRASEQWAAVLEERTREIQQRQLELRDAERLLVGEGAPEGDERSALIDRIDRLRVEIERMSTDAQRELDIVRRGLLEPVVARVRALVETYGEENGFDLILDTSAPEVALALAIRDIEITDELLAILEAAETPDAVTDDPDAEP